MKPPSKKTRLKLKLDNNDEDQFLGLVSAEADYKVSLLINQGLGLNLKSTSPVVKTVNKNEISFSRFTSDSKYSEIVYELISNDAGKEKLLSRIPSIDYILRIKGVSNKETIEDIIRKIRNIGEITGVFTLDKNSRMENNFLKIIP
ncbi:MAG: IPExxxVDY family protein [Bacteroidales bacterium]|nr:IPExxxVDY family protein [Bacteroidales bacterium]